MHQDITRVLVIRHGETAWNRESRIQGHIDIPLNDQGRWQAARLGRALADEPLAAIYSSDLQRAHDTALAVAEVRGVPVVTTEALRERLIGDLAAMQALVREGLELARSAESAEQRAALDLDFYIFGSVIHHLFDLDFTFIIGFQNRINQGVCRGAVRNFLDQKGFAILFLNSGSYLDFSTSQSFLVIRKISQTPCEKIR